jgi:beta-lactamase class A
MNDSDNTATDYLLERIGGPKVLENDLRALGLTHIQIARGCLEHLRDRCGVTQDMPLNNGKAMADFVALLEGKMEVMPLASLKEADAAFDADERDTTSPEEMTILLKKIWDRDAGISEASTEVLFEIMAQCRTGLNRFPARLPNHVKVLHKTGSCGGRANNVGFILYDSGDGMADAIALSVYAMGPPSASQTTTREMYMERDRVISDIARACYDCYLYNAL